MSSTFPSRCAGDFKVELSGGFRDPQARVDEYVVTDQLRQAFGRALGIVRAAVRNDSSYAVYLHGSFGSGKSHFLTVLHAILNNDPVAPAKPGLQAMIADHDDWLRGRRFLMVPYHLVGATDIDSALLDGYVKTVRRRHPDEQLPRRCIPAERSHSPRRRRPVVDVGRVPANATLVATLSGLTDAKQRFDDESIRLRADLTPAMWTADTADAAQRLCLPEIDKRALRGLKFSEALHERLAIATLAARLADLDSAAHMLAEPVRFVSTTG